MTAGSRARVVVIGAGMGGLATAARLAAAGHRVTVVEQAPAVGGKVGWFSRDGFGFDTGPSLLTLPGVYRDLFSATGTPLEQHVDLVPLDPACRYRLSDGTWLDLPGTGHPDDDTDDDMDGGHAARVATALDASLGEGAGQQWLAVLDRACRMWEASRDAVLTRPLRSAATLARYATRLDDLRTIAPWLSLRDLGRRMLPDTRLRPLLDRYATYSGSDPRQAPAVLATAAYVEHAFGSWYVRGGIRRLADAVHERAVSLGADVRTGVAVTEVVLDGARVGGVRLATGEHLAADVVVSAVDVAHLVRDLLPHGEGHRAGAARLRRVTPSMSGLVILLALKGRTPGLSHHTVTFPADYDDEFDSVVGTGRHAGRPRAVPDPAIYVSAPDDPVTRPDEEHEAWFVLVNAPRHCPQDPAAGIDWRAADATGAPLAESYADHLLEVMARRGLDVRERLLWREVRTPADLEDQTRSVGGSIYGSSGNGARSAFLRPANTTAVRGLYLTGGSTHPGGGLPLVALSAEIVAGLVDGFLEGRAGSPSTIRT
jgi:phytoene desaturase